MLNAFKSSPPSAMYISDPKMTMPKQRLNANTSRAFVDFSNVRPMTITGATNAGLLKALKMRVRRTSRKTTKAPPSASIKVPSTPGKMAAKSTMLAGVRMNRHNLCQGVGKTIGSKPTTSSCNFALSCTSILTAHTVHIRTPNSITKIKRQPFSMASSIEQLSGLMWHSGMVLMMKHTEEIKMVRSTRTETTCESTEDSGLSKVRYKRSQKDKCTLMFLRLYTRKNSPHATCPSPSSS
mmetsp:Transcript_107874/g.302069  ORF Transcript_107874/g.302069 Transcript_107874/m.302069 type:complete len:238 (-) Transcript_107874:395-1108(-)